VGNTDAFGVVLTPCNQRAVNLLSCAYSENSASGCRIKIVKQKELINNGNSRCNLTFLSFGSGSPKARFDGANPGLSSIVRAGQAAFTADVVTLRASPAADRWTKPDFAATR
jgi:hypothetical protein